MTLRILAAVARQGRLRMSYLGMGLARALYRVTWLASATQHGVLASVAAGRVPLEDLTRIHAPGPGGCEALQAWLQLGVQLRHLAGDPSGYPVRRS